MGDESPYRRRLVRLPLQRSLFAGIERAADLVGVAAVLPGGRFGARVDSSGDLFIDPEHVERLSSALQEDLGEQAVEAMLQNHRFACTSLLEAIEVAGGSVGSLDRSAGGRELRRVGARVSVILAYGILARFVPDIVLTALRASGDTAVPPFPRPSAGTRLSRDLAGLFMECVRRGYGPARLEASWPEVDSDIRSLVMEFTTGHIGFGPLGWDSPGYEDPAYVVRAVRQAFDGVDPGLVRASLETRRRPPETAPGSGLRALLAMWLEFLERETWYVRRAFFLAIGPLAHQVGESLRHGGVDLGPGGPLFLELDELAGPATPPVLALTAERRRRDYLADEAHSVEAIGRLRWLLEPR